MDLTPPSSTFLAISQPSPLSPDTSTCARQQHQARQRRAKKRTTPRLLGFLAASLPAARTHCAVTQRGGFTAGGPNASAGSVRRGARAAEARRESGESDSHSTTGWPARHPRPAPRSCASGDLCPFPGCAGARRLVRRRARALAQNKPPPRARQAGARGCTASRTRRAAHSQNSGAQRPRLRAWFASARACALLTASTCIGSAIQQLLGSLEANNVSSNTDGLLTTNLKPAAVDSMGAGRGGVERACE